MFGRKRRVDDFSAEIEAHIEHEVARLREQGLSEEEARARARRGFGNVTRSREEFYESGRWMWWETFWQDVQYGVRMLRKSPGFTVIAVLTLALGIGANTSIFSLVNAILIRPLPYPNPEQLVGLGQSRMQQGAGYIQTGVSLPNVEAITLQNTVFQEVAYYRFHSYNLIQQNAPERVLSFQISGRFLPMFGIQPRIGRFFSDEESQPGKDGEAIISFGLWQRRFGGTSDVLGKSVLLDQRPYTIVGVMPRDFQYVWGAPVDVLVPLAPTPAERGESARNSRNLETLARMRPGVTHAQAQGEMNALAQRLAEEYPDANKGWNITVEPLHAAYHRHLAEPLLVLMGAVSFVLLIVCANVANLLLSRVTARRREVAIRLSMGASNLRMIRQLLTESLLLAILGGGCGLLLAYWGTAALRRQASQFMFNPALREMGLDWRVLVYTLAVALLTSIIFGLAPALHASKANLNDTLKESALSVTPEAGHTRLRSALVIAETALAIVLMTGAGLLIRTFVHILGVDTGFNPAHALTMRVSLPNYKYSTDSQRFAFFRDTLDRIRAVHGVEAAGSFDSVDAIFFSPANQARPAPGQEPTAIEHSISPEYFAAMGAKFLSGRDFSSLDAPGSPLVVIINRTIARRYWPNSNPIGDHISVLDNVYDRDQQTQTQRLLTVVGIVGDVKLGEDVWKDEPELYVPFSQQPRASMAIFIRTEAAPMSVLPGVRSAILAIDDEQPITEPRTMEEEVALDHEVVRFPMALIWIFAALALILSAIGIFGVMSYSVSQRTHELAIRIALGAGRRDILKLTVGEGLRITFVGVAVGVVLALIVSRLIASDLYGVSAHDPLTFGAVVLLLVVVAALACLIPAQRASRVDPIVALRYE